MSVDVSRIPSPMQGLCYQPAPIDYIGNQGQYGKYFDTDFFNTDFPGFWSTANGGRGDLANMSDLGINFIHLYNWNPQRDHSTFLQECAARGLSVAVPFSNWFAENVGVAGTAGSAAAIYSIVQEIVTLGGGTTPYSAVAMWTIANEYNQGGGPSAAQIAQTAQVLLYAETQLGVTVKLPISSPTSFAPANSPGIAPTQALQTAFGATTSFKVTIPAVSSKPVTIPALPTDFFANRYVAATNPQNAGSSPPASAGLTLATWLPKYEAAFPNTPLWFSEIGIGETNSCNGYASSCVPSDTQQAAFTLNQLQNAEPETGSPLLGSCIFEYTTDYQNPPGTNNYTFSLLADDGITSKAVDFTIPQSAPQGKGETYPVQCLKTTKPVYASVKGLWNPSGGTSPASYCATKPKS